MELISCPRCHTRVIPKSNGECPACRRPLDKAADVRIEAPPRLSEDPEDNPYRVGPAADGSRDDRIELQPKLVPRTHGSFRLLGLTNLFAAAFLILFVVGSLWFLSRLGIHGIARNAGNRLFQVWAIERGLALPLLIALHLWLARGLTHMQGRAILVQTILSALVASWALILTFDDLFLFKVALDEVDVAPHVALIDIAYYLTKFVSGFGHATIAFLLFRFIRAERIPARPSAPESVRGAKNSDVNTTDFTNGGAHFIGYLLATPAAIVLSLGTLWSVRWLILELARRIFIRALLS
jgi:hypothetical protein